MRQTCYFGFKRAAHYVLRPSVFNGDEIVAGRHGCVGDLVALRTLPAVHLDLGRSIYVDRQCGRARVAGVHHKLRRNAWKE